jgi:hypothetical protein
LVPHRRENLAAARSLDCRMQERDARRGAGWLHGRTSHVADDDTRGGDPRMEPLLRVYAMIDFALEARKFRARGIEIMQRPGEYAVNVINGKSDTEQTRETLDDALALAEIMAKSEPALAATKAARYRAPRRKRMTPKAHNKRMRRAHWHRMVARAKRERKDQT